MIINSEIKSLLPIKDLDNVYVVTDFDRTITNGNSKTSWSILASSITSNNNFRKIEK